MYSQQLRSRCDHSPLKPAAMQLMEAHSAGWPNSSSQVHCTVVMHPLPESTPPRSGRTKRLPLSEVSPPTLQETLTQCPSLSLSRTPCSHNGLRCPIR